VPYRRTPPKIFIRPTEATHQNFYTPHRSTPSKICVRLTGGRHRKCSYAPPSDPTENLYMLAEKCGIRKSKEFSTLPAEDGKVTNSALFRPPPEKYGIPPTVYVDNQSTFADVPSAITYTVITGNKIKWDNSRQVGHRQQSCDFYALTAVCARLLSIVKRVQNCPILPYSVNGQATVRQKGKETHSY